MIKVIIQNEDAPAFGDEFESYILFGFNADGINVAGHYHIEQLMAISLEIQRRLLGLASWGAEGEPQGEGGVN